MTLIKVTNLGLEVAQEKVRKKKIVQRKKTEIIAAKTAEIKERLVCPIKIMIIS